MIRRRCTIVSNLFDNRRDFENILDNLFRIATRFADNVRHFQFRRLSRRRIIGAAYFCYYSCCYRCSTDESWAHGWTRLPGRGGSRRVGGGWQSTQGYRRQLSESRRVVMTAGNNKVLGCCSWAHCSATGIGQWVQEGKGNDKHSKQDSDRQADDQQAQSFAHMRRYG
ncbi:MAG: hypothetical protein KatS3mg058_2544 [Roseiflexus sp.]|nr:MAG: hypothetical protein KatS3mg058_2544 [Roseiflexus sp.]